MVNRQMAHNYLRNKVENASPIGRIMILMEACFRFMDQSIRALEKGDKVAFVERNIKAQNIIRELRNSLNLEVDEKIAGGFYNLYNFMLKQLMQSVRTKKIEPINNVKKQLDQLYQAWKTAEQKGLGKDIKRAEERTQKDGSMVRRINGTESQYLQANAGLNVIS